MSVLDKLLDAVKLNDDYDEDDFLDDDILDESDDDFLDDVSTNAQTAVKNLQLASGVVSIDDDDYDDKYEKQGKPSHYITLEKAKEIALAQAGVKASAAVFDDKEFDLDDGSAVYELEFEANGNEYEYDVNAVTGKVMKAEHDIAGQNDDRDDDMDGADDRDDDRDDDWDDVDLSLIHI